LQTDYWSLKQALRWTENKNKNKNKLCLDTTAVYQTKQIKHLE